MKRVLAALLLIGLLSACGSATGSRPTPSPSTTPGASPSTAPSPSPSASPSATPSPTAAPSPTPPAGFACTAVSGGAASGSAVTAVRVGQHDGYDRFVIEFGGAIPIYSVTPQAGTTFTRSPRGDQVTLEGTSGVLIVLHPVADWTGYSGPTAFRPEYPALRQAVLTENFEGYQRWALGIEGASCLRVAEFSSPNRLVVDIATA